MAPTDVPRRAGAALCLTAAVFVAAGGWVHLREWLDTYRAVPADVPGAALVRIGFPVNFGVSVALAAALVGLAVRPARRARLLMAGAAALFQAASLAVLVRTRTAPVLGWFEPGWTVGQDQSKALEIGALVVLAGVVAVELLDPQAAGSRRKVRR